MLGLPAPFPETSLSVVEILLKSLNVTLKMLFSFQGMATASVVKGAFSR